MSNMQPGKRRLVIHLLFLNTGTIRTVSRRLPEKAASSFVAGMENYSASVMPAFFIQIHSVAALARAAPVQIMPSP